MTQRALFYLHAASPLHVGTGQSLDVIDLPIQRERGTNLPVVAGSAVKGVARAECQGRPELSAFVNSAFGNDKKPSEGAGAVTFGDARLLLLPIRSVRLLFAWATCPYILRRYLRDRVECGLDTEQVQKTNQAMLDSVLRTLKTTAACADAGLLLGVRDQEKRGKAYVEDADLDTTIVPELGAFAATLAAQCLPDTLASLLPERLLVVNDTLFGTFSRQCTEIAARVSLHRDLKTATNLWYEESLPAETVLYGTVLAEQTRRARNTERTGGGDAYWTGKEHLTKLRAAVASAQFGGKASVGRGLCHVAWEAA